MWRFYIVKRTIGLSQYLAKMRTLNARIKSQTKRLYLVRQDSFTPWLCYCAQKCAHRSADNFPLLSSTARRGKRKVPSDHRFSRKSTVGSFKVTMGLFWFFWSLESLLPWLKLPGLCTAWNRESYNSNLNSHTSGRQPITWVDLLPPRSASQGKPQTLPLTSYKLPLIINLGTATTTCDNICLLEICMLYWRHSQ